MKPHAPCPLDLSFELFDFAMQMRAARHRSEHPNASEADVAAVVRAWVSDRPGAPFGDCDATVVAPSRAS